MVKSLSLCAFPTHGFPVLKIDWESQSWFSDIIHILILSEDSAYLVMNVNSCINSKHIRDIHGIELYKQNKAGLQEPSENIC